MNLINIFCFIFLIYARASSNETLTTSTDLTITSTDGITTDTTPYETTSYISDRFDESSASDAVHTTGDSFSDSITSTTLSYDSISTIDTQTTTETSTDVPEETTKIPGIVHPSFIPRGNFDTHSTPKPLEPSSDGKGHKLEIPEEKEADVGKKKIINTSNPSILRPEDSDESGDLEMLEGGNVDASNTEKNMKITDAGNDSEPSKGNDISSTEEKMINTEAGTESKVSKGKAAGILVASCILAVVIIWISKMVYTRYQSRTYDVRHGIEMRNP